MRQLTLLSFLNINAMLLTRLKTLLTVTVVTVVLSACASSGSTGSITAGASNGASNGASRISACKAGDTQIQSRNQCLQDDAACYQLSNNQWCTGERGNSCPAGSTALPAGVACPAGKRCFDVAESLRCTIS